MTAGGSFLDTPLASELEQLHIARDLDSGLVAVVAIHDRTLGPARGGTRLRTYAGVAEAARDAARLARPMTLKFAVHSLSWGGAKAVILQDARGESSREVLEERLRAYGRFLEGLGGAFGTGPDLGIGAAEIAVIQETTGCVVDVHSHEVSSVATAAGVRIALAQGLERTLGGGLEGKRVAIQGVGAVGGALARDLAGRGARLVLADVDSERAAALASELRAEVSAPDEILTLEVDAMAPCAAGEIITGELVSRLRCRVIAGAANDPLAPPEEVRADALAGREILYIPDFVANGGAALVLTSGVQAGGGEAAAEGHLAAAERSMEATCRDVLDRAERDGVTPLQAAVRLANDTLAAARTKGS